MRRLFITSFMPQNILERPRERQYPKLLEQTRSEIRVHR